MSRNLYLILELLLFARVIMAHPETLTPNLRVSMADPKAIGGNPNPQISINKRPYGAKGGYWAMLTKGMKGVMGPITLKSVEGCDYEVCETLTPPPDVLLPLLI